MDKIPEQELKKLADKIKSIREKKELTQADVASKASLHVNYYARLERGEVNPSYETLRKLSVALKVKSSEILPF